MDPRRVLSLSICLLVWRGAVFAAAESAEKLPQTHVHAAIIGSDLFERVAETAGSIRDLSAQVDFQVRLSTLGLAFKVEGDYFYKSPDKMRLKIHDVPNFILQRENQAFRTTNILAGLRRDLRRDYTTRILSESPFKGESCYVLQLIPKKDEGISRILLWIDKAHYTMPQVIIRYADGSDLVQEKEYVLENQVFVVSKIESNYTAPEMRAQILAQFRNYRINQGVTDRVFEEPHAETNLVSAF